MSFRVFYSLFFVNLIIRFISIPHVYDLLQRRAWMFIVLAANAAKETTKSRDDRR